MANIEKEGRERTRNKGEAVGKEVRGEKKKPWNESQSALTGLEKLSGF